MNAKANRSVMRAAMREVVQWLEADLFVAERTDEPGARAFRGPAGHRVVVQPRDDLRGVSGWVERPDGTAIVITSWLDPQTLSEHLP